MEYRLSVKFVWVSLILGWWLFLIPPIVAFIRYKYSKIVVGDKFVTRTETFLTTNRRDIPYANIHAISTQQGTTGKLLGWGHIAISTGNMAVPIVFKFIDKPDELRQVVQAKIGDKT